MAQLEHARKLAMKTLAALPYGTELYVDLAVPATGNPSLFLGLGMLVGKKQAVYVGGGHFRLNDAGRAAFIAGDADDKL